MITIRKILYPTDFSECADGALSWALMLAKNFEAELTMFHAVVLHGDDVGDEVYSRFPDIERCIEKLMQNADSRLERRIQDSGEVNISQKVRRGLSVTDEILGYAGEEEVDLIIMGTHGRKGLKHLLLGSVAERVIRNSSCPVLCVRHKGDGADSLVDVKRIVLPIDFSGHCKVSARYAVALTKLLGAKLEVVHVIDRSIHPSFYSVGKETLLELDSELENRTVGAIKEFMSEFIVTTTYESRVLEGQPAQKINEIAGDQLGTLVIIASHGANGIERLMMGSTTERVIRSSKCPVLIVKLNERDFVK